MDLNAISGRRPALLSTLAKLAWLTTAVACASGASSAPRRQVTLRTTGQTNQLSIAKGGEITGPTLQLSPTSEGYRGLAGSAIIDLRSDGERIVGTIHERMVDLHIDVEGDALVVRGLFAGRLGRLEANSAEIRSTLGACTYELFAKSSHYEGQRACGQATFPVIRPATLELPAGFERLPIDRQVMLLAVLLTL